MTFGIRHGRGPRKEGEPDPTLGEFLRVFVLLIVFIFQLLATVGGAIEGSNPRFLSRDPCVLAGKWKYVFVTYIPACRFSEWMGK